MYSLSPSRTASSARVASARATGRTPVTRGSRVPEWPAFGTPNMSRTHALTWWRSGLSACRRSPRRVGSVPRSTGPRVSFRTSSRAHRGGRRGRSSPHPRGDLRDDLVRSPVPGVDHEIEDPHVSDVDSVDRFVPDPFRLLAGEDLAFRLLHGRPLPAGDSFRAHREWRVDEHLEAGDFLLLDQVCLNPSIDHDVPALRYVGTDFG